MSTESGDSGWSELLVPLNAGVFFIAANTAPNGFGTVVFGVSGGLFLATFALMVWQAMYGDK